MTESIAFVLHMLGQWWSFQLPFGITFGVLILTITGIPILWWAFRKFLGGG